MPNSITSLHTADRNMDFPNEIKMKIIFFKQIYEREIYINIYIYMGILTYIRNSLCMCIFLKPWYETLYRVWGTKMDHGERVTCHQFSNYFLIISFTHHQSLIISLSPIYSPSSFSFIILKENVEQSPSIFLKNAFLRKMT